MKVIQPSWQSHFTRPRTSRTGLGAPRSARLSLVPLLAVSCMLWGGGRTSALASDPVGVYAVVDKIIFEPNATSPERVQVWGAFAIAQGNGNEYKSAERGFLYYKLDPAKPAVCKTEWSDLKSVAGTGQIVAFGFRHAEKGKLRLKDAKTENPDVYPVAMGLRKVRDEQGYQPVGQLMKLRDAVSKEKAPAATPAR